MSGKSARAKGKALEARRAMNHDAQERPAPRTHVLTFADLPPGVNAACILCGQTFVDCLEADAAPCEPAREDAA